ncbi:TPA: hypothetical protein ACXJPA_000898 [Serratia marcescens]
MHYNQSRPHSALGWITYRSGSEVDVTSRSVC